VAAPCRPVRAASAAGRAIPKESRHPLPSTALTDDSRVLALADRVVDVTFTLHEAPDQTDRDRRAITCVSRSAASMLRPHRVLSAIQSVSYWQQ
jgi:hypothetical protein